MITAFDLARLPGEWWSVWGTPEARTLEDELARETSPGHDLHGDVAEAVAVKRHLKDVIFWLPETEHWAFVHLTYRHERDPRWPDALIAEHLDQIVEELVDVQGVIDGFRCPSCRGSGRSGGWQAPCSVTVCRFGRPGDWREVLEAHHRRS